ncbi:MAG: hypothetical protein ACRCUY_12920 [Thermoguttaceae bacterium]
MENPILLWGQQDGGIVGIVIFLVILVVQSIITVIRTRQEETAKKLIIPSEDDDTINQQKNRQSLKRNRQYSKKVRPEMAEMAEMENTVDEYQSSVPTISGSEISNNNRDFAATRSTFSPSNNTNFQSEISPNPSSLDGQLNDSSLEITSSTQTLSLHPLAALLARPRGIHQAIILNELLNYREQGAMEPCQKSNAFTKVSNTHLMK